MDKKFKAQEKRAKREERKNAPAAPMVDQQSMSADEDEDLAASESSELTGS